MLFFKTRIAVSQVGGKGLFAATRIPRGAIVGDLTYKCEFLTEDEYQTAQRAGNRGVIQSAVRAFGRLFVYAPTKEAQDAFDNEDYTNHSENANLLYHCGILFAQRDIAGGEELTVDYRYFLAQEDESSFIDAETGKLVSGLGAADALRRSTLELLALLPFIVEDQGGVRTLASAVGIRTPGHAPRDFRRAESMHSASDR